MFVRNPFCESQGKPKRQDNCIWRCIRAYLILPHNKQRILFKRLIPSTSYGDDDDDDDDADDDADDDDDDVSFPMGVMLILQLAASLSLCRFDSLECEIPQVRAIIQPPATVDLEQEHLFLRENWLGVIGFWRYLMMIYIHTFIYYNNLLMYN